MLERSLASVCAQTSDEYRVIVVCNEIPHVEHSSKVEFLQVDFDPPSVVDGPITGMQAVRIDKGTKLLVGLIEAAKWRPDYVMFFDADDLVSNRLAGFVAENSGANGWYLREGYIYSDGTSLWRRLTDFHHKCGTSHIIRYDLFELFVPNPMETSQDALIRVFGERFIKHIIGCHMTIERYFHCLDAPLSPLPFLGALYVVDTGENHSGSSALAYGRRLTEPMREEFCLPPPPGDNDHWMVQNLSAIAARFKRLRWQS